MKRLVHVTVALLCGATIALICYAHQEDGRIEEVSLALAQDAKGQVVAVLQNGSRGRVAVLTAPCAVEVLAGNTWAVPQSQGFVCGNRDFQQASVPAGRKIEFLVYERMDLVKTGQTIRVSVHVASGFNQGRVVSNALVFSKAKKG
jgi:hypothetical protein